ncbi:hypothetical protein [Sulfurimonas sp. HSL-1716]|uniref:hypothetical protein n=1 Tax=Hydrocurvibacter sulfurireducens TaxID=3131937 RepID=UPI0031F9A56F
MKRISVCNAAIVAMLLAVVGVDNAYAVPSFARQTGLDCTACHTVFPELTKVGRDFKLRGYTMEGGTTKMPLPLAAMIMAEVTNVSDSSNGSVVNGNGQNRNGELVIPQISLFYGGKIYKKVGAFIQVTYDGTLLPQDKAVSPYTAMDNADIRYADSVMLHDKELIYGISVNNNPSVQDLWNSTSAWGFPYASSSVAPAPSAATLIDGGLGQVAAGASAYVMWDDTLYAELGIYQTIPKGGIQGVFGWNNGGSDPVVYGDAPYGRIALQHDFGDHYLMVGSYAMTTRIRQDGTDKLDTYRDWAVDAEYQFDYDKHNVTATATRIWEGANLDASYATGGADNGSDSLTTTKVRASYRYDHKYGASLGYVTTSGNVDATKYGTGTGSPDSSYEIIEADYLPINKIKFSLQYTMYDKFDGARKNYDGAGRNASDNDTLYLIGWFMF